MTTTPILGITLVEPDQTGKFDTINAMFTVLDNATQEVKTHDLSGGNVTVTGADFVAYQVHQSSGNAVSRVLTVPATIRAFVAWNDGSADLTVTVFGGSS